MTLSLTKDNNEITLRKHGNIFIETKWTTKVVGGLKQREKKRTNLFQRGLEMNNDSYNVRIQDIRPATGQEILKKALPQLSSYNSLIYDLISERRKTSSLGLCF